MNNKKQIIIDGVDILKEKINMCFILLINKLETPETIEQTIYEHLDAFVEEWNTQLIRKTQECEQLQEKYEALKLENQEGYEIVAELKQECEELKKQLKNTEKRRVKSESLNEKLDIENTRYRKALKEIEEIYKTAIKNITTYDESNDLNITIEALHNISDIINKAKGE